MWNLESQDVLTNNTDMMEARHQLTIELKNLDILHI
jgi:hypothetical protein